MPVQRVGRASLAGRPVSDPATSMRSLRRVADRTGSRSGLGSRCPIMRASRCVRPPFGFTLGSGDEELHRLHGFLAGAGGLRVESSCQACLPTGGHGDAVLAGRA